MLLTKKKDISMGHMGVPDVEQAKRRLHDILLRAKSLHVPTREVLSTRPAMKLLGHIRSTGIWIIILGMFLLLLSTLIYVHWPSQEVETVRTVLRHTCGPTASDKFSERVAALLHTSTTQDDC